MTWISFSRSTPGVPADKLAGSSITLGGENPVSCAGLSQAHCALHEPPRKWSSSRSEIFREAAQRLFLLTGTCPYFEVQRQWHGCRETTVHVGAPVSYTHLRAHETVLDLVCRLLL